MTGGRPLPQAEMAELAPEPAAASEGQPFFSHLALAPAPGRPAQGGGPEVVDGLEWVGMPATRSPAQLTLATFVENKVGMAGVAIIVLLVVFCFVGPHVYLTNQKTVNPVLSNLRPTGAHPLGTDGEGFDVLGRLMLGGQSSIEIGLTAGLCAAFFGTLYGAISAVAGGAIDTVLMRIVDALSSLPALLLLILMSTIFRPSLPLMVLVISVVSWLDPARLVRGEALSLRTREYVQAVRVAGGTQSRIVIRHIIPNTMGTIVVNTSFLIANSILALASLSFLGLGLPDSTPTWGGMLSNGTNVIYDGYWWQLYPAGIAIVLTVVAFNFIGDGLRDCLDVRLQRR